MRLINNLLLLLTPPLFHLFYIHLLSHPLRSGTVAWPNTASCSAYAVVCAMGPFPSDPSVRSSVEIYTASPTRWRATSATLPFQKHFAPVGWWGGLLGHGWGHVGEYTFPHVDPLPSPFSLLPPPPPLLPLVCNGLGWTARFFADLPGLKV